MQNVGEWQILSEYCWKLLPDHSLNDLCMQWLRLISFEQNAAKELVLKDRSKKLSQTLKKSFYNFYIKENDNVINSLIAFVQLSLAAIHWV